VSQLSTLANVGQRKTQCCFEKVRAHQILNLTRYRPLLTFNGNGMKDMSQWGEQELITQFFGDFKGTFLDIGAYDGITSQRKRKGSGVSSIK